MLEHRSVHAIGWIACAVGAAVLVPHFAAGNPPAPASTTPPAVTARIPPGTLAWSSARGEPSLDTLRLVQRTAALEVRRCLAPFMPSPVTPQAASSLEFRVVYSASGLVIWTSADDASGPSERCLATIGRTVFSVRNSSGHPVLVRFPLRGTSWW